MSVFSQDAKAFDADSFNVAVTYMMPVSYPARLLTVTEWHCVMIPLLCICLIWEGCTNRQ